MKLIRVFVLTFVVAFLASTGSVGVGAPAHATTPVRAASSAIQSCRDIIGYFVRPSLSLREMSAQQLAELIAVDEETQKLVSNPVVAQYIYLRKFTDQKTDGEIRRALQDFVNDKEVKYRDLFNLVEEKLAAKISDPVVQEKIRATFAGNDRTLRPGGFRSRIEKSRGTLKQLLAIPVSMARARKLTYEGFSQENMDRGFFDFYGATQLGLPESQQRVWEKIPGGLSAIRPAHIVNMSPASWAAIARMASETEMPIEGYSLNSGEALRALLPAVSAFMGKNLEEYQSFAQRKEIAAAAKEKVGPYCTNVWCTEENRHEQAIESFADQIEGVRNLIPKKYDADPIGDFSDMDYAIKHLVGRNSSEWNANSAYLFLSAHGEGPAEIWPAQVRRDETKHMAIFAGAYKYLFGNQPGLRTKMMFQKVLALKNAAGASYSDTNALSGEPATMIEVAAIHLFVEIKVREYLRSLPLKTMEKFLDGPVLTLKEIETIPVPEEKLRKIAEIAAREKAKRERLERWLPEERERYLALREVESKHGALIENFITNLFNNFEGGEGPGSAKAKAIIRQIGKIQTGLDKQTNAFIQESLRETLRDYQIINNALVRSKPELSVKLKNAREGFIVVQRKEKSARVIKTVMLTDDHMLLRVEKPLGLSVAVGGALKVTLKTAAKEESRVLSITNSPSQNFFEFAATISDSAFKKAFGALKPGDQVLLEPVKSGLNFKMDRPAVLIAGGIGITPFRSMIQRASETGFRQPTLLLYGNRTQIPFEAELDVFAATSPNFRVVNTLSQPGPSWDGLSGRIDENFLARSLVGVPQNAQYYVVGSPQMVNDVGQALKRLRIEPGSISSEAFFAGDALSSAASFTGSLGTQAGTPNDPTICFCHSVTQGQLERAVLDTDGSLAAVQTETNAGTGCGNCLCNVEGIINKCRGGN